MAESVAETLPGMLSENEQHAWDFQVETDPVAAGHHHVLHILAALADQTSEHGWDFAICLTDLPLRRGRHPILAEVNRDQGVAVVALPSLGGVDSSTGDQSRKLWQARRSTAQHETGTRATSGNERAVP